MFLQVADRPVSAARGPRDSLAGPVPPGRPSPALREPSATPGRRRRGRRCSPARPPPAVPATSRAACLAGLRRSAARARGPATPRRTRAEIEHRRTRAENQHRRTRAENQHRRTRAENQHRRTRAGAGAAHAPAHLRTAQPGHGGLAPCRPARRRATGRGKWPMRTQVGRPRSTVGTPAPASPAAPGNRNTAHAPVTRNQHNGRVAADPAVSAAPCRACPLLPQHGAARPPGGPVVHTAPAIPSPPAQLLRR
jgi:hypothetical protein